MLFIDYSSAFNIIVPSKLIIKLEALGLSPALCYWVLDFQTGCPQVVKLGNNIPILLILNTDAPQWCVLNHMYSLFTHDRVAMHASNSIIKFVDYTTVVCLITNSNETAYREEVGHAQLRASCRAVSPPGTAIAPPTIASLPRGWYGLHNASLGVNYVPSRTPTAPDITGRPKRSSRVTATRATACSPHYHPEGEVSTGASKLGPRD
jgi:hypothetical protein